MPERVDEDGVIHDDERQFLDLQAETLTGDIRDVLLTHVRSMDVGWQLLTETQQRDKIYALEEAAKSLVRQSFQIVTQTKFPSLTVAVGKVVMDKGVQINLDTNSTIENITRLAQHGKQAAVMVLCDPDLFFGERDAARPDPDQRDMLDSQDEAA